MEHLRAYLGTLEYLLDISENILKEHTGAYSITYWNILKNIPETCLRMYLEHTWEHTWNILKNILEHIENTWEHIETYLRTYFRPAMGYIF